MKTDSFFYRFFSDFPAAFFALIGEDERKAQNYRFVSVEVKEQAFRFDGVFQPNSGEDDTYFVEVQFGKDDDFYSRFLAEIFLFLRQHRPPGNWRAVVLFPSPSFDPGVHRYYQEFFESGRLQRVYLSELPVEHLERFPLNLLQIVASAEQDVPAIALKIVRQLPKEILDEKERKEFIELLINLLMKKLPQLTREEIEKMFEPMLSDIKKSRAYQEIAQEGRQAERLEIAQAMLKKNMSLELISELTGLSLEEILEISRLAFEGKN